MDETMRYVAARPAPPPACTDTVHSLGSRLRTQARTARTARTALLRRRPRTRLYEKVWEGPPGGAGMPDLCLSVSLSLFLSVSLCLCLCLPACLSAPARHSVRLPANKPIRIPTRCRKTFESVAERARLRNFLLRSVTLPAGPPACLAAAAAAGRGAGGPFCGTGGRSGRSPAAKNALAQADG